MIITGPEDIFLIGEGSIGRIPVWSSIEWSKSIEPESDRERFEGRYRVIGLESAIREAFYGSESYRFTDK
jgi:hypothetical protein